MRIAVIGPPRDLHLQRWGKALQAAGADAIFIGIEPKPPELEPYFSVEPPVACPTLGDFWRRRGALRDLLEEKRVTVAHPIHLTPSAVWVWASGFRPYVPFAMGADVLEYGPQAPPLTHSWSLQGKLPRWKDYALAWLRRRALPPLLRLTLRAAAFSLADNYELCNTKKYFVKNKKYIEIPAGIRFVEGESGGGSLEFWGRLSRLRRPLLVAPRGATLLYRADIILEGFSLYLRQGGQNLALVLLAGPYPPHPTLQDKACELEKHFPDNFLFFEKVISKKDMKLLWQESAALLSAPLYDGYSYALAEGRFAGCLPVVPALPGYLELLTHGYNAYFVEPFTVQHLAAALHDLEPLLLHSERPWADPNRRWVQRFSNLSENAQTFLSLLEAYLSTPPKP